jgi:hypothetical protein
MISQNILWSRAINPGNCRIMREPTIFGVILFGLSGFIVLAAIIVLSLFISSFI